MAASNSERRDDMIQIIDDEGVVLEGAKEPPIGDEELLTIYRDMVFSRLFDEKAVSLQRQGRMSTYPPLSGQEGAQVPSTQALEEDDWIIYQYREHGAVVNRGMVPAYLRYWMGFEDGNRILGDHNIFPINISIAGHLPHATGMAWASKLKGENRVFLCHFGDGATSEGDFHEALNFGGVFDLPIVYFCNNNQWAISTPRERQTASATLAQKATAYGLSSVRVDGMDPLAVYKVTSDAIDKARNPSKGDLRPTLIEAIHYRFGAHTTADDPEVYRDNEEVERWKRRDPIPRMEKFLRKSGRLDDELVNSIRSELEEELNLLVEKAEAGSEKDPDDMFEYVFETITPGIQRQREQYRIQRESRSGD